jgi:hypothetical protein
MSEEFRDRLRNIIETDKIKTVVKQDETKQFVQDWYKIEKKIFAVLQETESEFRLEERTVEAKKYLGDVILTAGKRSYELRFHPEFRKIQVAVKTSTPSGRDENLYPIEWLSKESVEKLVEEFLASVFRL